MLQLENLVWYNWSLTLQYVKQGSNIGKHQIHIIIDETTIPAEISNSF